MSNTSQISLCNVTVIDHAYIDDKGNVVGGSFHGSFIVSGKMDPIEKVVVDFSTIKKDLKHWIDNKECGFDHKLWVIEGWSKVDSIITSFDEDNNEQLKITTPNVVLSVPQSAIKHIKDVPIIAPGYTTEYISAAITMFLHHNLRPIYPDAELVVETYLSRLCETFNPLELNGTAPIYFRYSHGLKDSTSWGCQNIAHGHLSFIVAHFVEHELTDVQLMRLMCALRGIASDLDNVVFVNADNIVTSDDDSIQLEYTTERGTFTAKYKNHKVIVLKTETTIEYIVEYVKQSYGSLLLDAGVVKLTVSEGLSKGAVIDL